MNLKDLLPKNLPFFNSAPQNNEYYFALNIGSDLMTAAVWGLSGNKLQIVNTAKVKVSGDEDLVEASNNLLDEVLQDFQPEPSKILFGVPDSWMMDDNLKETHLNFLKHLVKELDVDPLAYVSTTHAISHLIQKQSGVPATIILVAISDPLTVTVVKGGKVIGSKSVKRSQDLPRDIDKALQTFTDLEVLPPKITLFGEGNLDRYKDELLGYNWMGTLSFLHLPKIEVLEEGIAIKAICLAGAVEINPDVVLAAAPINFVQPRNVMPGSDLMDEEFHNRRVNPQYEENEIATNVRLPAHSQVGISQGVAIAGGVEGVLGQVKGKWSRFLGFLQSKSFSLKLPNGRSARITGMVILPVVLLILLLVGYLFLSKATVTIFVDPKTLEKDAQVVADPTVTKVDQTGKIIPGKIVETNISGSAKGSATGTKQVGDQAKGTVDIYNKTDSPQTFSQGTVLVGDNNLQFTLDSSVTVASASAGVSGTSYGKATSNATAKQIGPDSNLSSGKNLTIQGQNSSSYNAVVDQAFSGGTSKNVTVVTSDDQKKALAALASDLRSQAQTKLQSKLTGDEKILPEALAETITSTNYSQKVGDQAPGFDVNMTIDYKGTAYSDNDLKSMVATLVETNVPDGYELNLSQTQTQADVSQLQKDGKLIFLAKFKASLFPKLDENKIKQEIKGKSPGTASTILQGIDNVIGSDISLKPSLPGPLKIIPILPQNINIVVTTK